MCGIIFFEMIDRLHGIEYNQFRNENDSHILNFVLVLT